MTIATMKDMPTSEVLAQALALMEEKGWIRGVAKDRTGCHCSMGAIASVLYGDANARVLVDVDGEDSEVEAAYADNKHLAPLVLAIEELGGQTHIEQYRAVYYWNDSNKDYTSGPVPPKVRAAFQRGIEIAKLDALRAAAKESINA